MAMETKQLHALSRIYNEKIAKDAMKSEGVYDTVKTVMDKGSNFVKNNPVGKALGSVVAPVKGNTGKNLPTAATQKAKGLRTEVLGGTPGDGYIGHPKLNIKNPISPPKVKTKTSTNKGLAGKLGNRANQLSDAMKEEKKAAKDYDGDGKVESGKDEYFGSKDKAIKKAMGKKVKESYSDWRYDLKEVPNYSQIPISSTKRNEKITEKNVKNNIKINPDMKEGYEATKTKEVMGALKKRDLKKDVKKKIAADIVKKKGDTSKSDDRYAYESKLWDQVAANLTELGELNDADFRVKGYQKENYQAMRNPEKEEKKDKRSEREKRMADPKRGINSPAFKEFMRQQGM